MAAPCSKWVNNGKADQVSDDDLATKGTGNILTVMLWQMEFEPNSKKSLYFSKNTEMSQRIYYKGIMTVKIYKCCGQNISPIPLRSRTKQGVTKQSNPFKRRGFC
jgi:hypothetical protein